MKSSNKFIIGFGTGRCGTKSFATLMSKQPSTLSTHEFTMMPWEFDGGAFIDLVSQLRYHSGPNTPCDAGFYWLNYLPHLIALFPETRAVCLTRNRDDVIRSWVNNMAEGASFFTSKSSSHFAGFKDGGKHHFFPSYDLPKDEAISQYYDDYHKEVFNLYMAYPDNIKTVLSPQVFNEETLQSEMLSFMGIPEEGQVISLGIHANPSSKRWKNVPNMLMYNLESKEFKKLDETLRR